MTFAALDSELLGPLFATSEMRAVFSDRTRLAAMLEVEAALADAQAEHGIVPAGLSAAIRGIATADLDMASLGEATALAGVPTIPFVKAVQARLPKELEPFFHRGATTQDILDTALVLQMRSGLDALMSDMDGAITGLAKLADEHRRTVCIGRTYGQHAAPVTFGYKAAVWCFAIAEVAERLPALRSRVLVASLGGPVGTLAALGAQGPAVADAFAGRLGLRAAPIAWHTLRAGMVEAATWLAMLLGALAKFATDVAHLASTEVGEVSEPYVAGRGGSSSMPHKRNPVSATVILAAQGAAAGHVATMIGSMAAAHERPAGAWHAEWHALPQLFGLASGALREAARLAAGLEVNTGRMRRNLEATSGLIFADSAAASLARHLGSEAAHRLVEAAATTARSNGGTLLDVLRSEANIPEAARAELDRAFDPTPGIDAAALWTERALRAVEAMRIDKDEESDARHPG